MMVKISIAEKIAEAAQNATYSMDFLEKTAQSNNVLMSAEVDAACAIRVNRNSNSINKKRWTHALKNAILNIMALVATKTATTATTSKVALMVKNAIKCATTKTNMDVTTATNATPKLVDSKTHASMSVIKDGATRTVCPAKTTQKTAKMKDALKDALTVFIAIPNIKKNIKKIQTIAHTSNWKMEDVSSTPEMVTVDTPTMSVVWMVNATKSLESAVLIHLALMNAIKDGATTTAMPAFLTCPTPITIAHQSALPDVPTAKSVSMILIVKCKRNNKNHNAKVVSKMMVNTFFAKVTPTARIPTTFVDKVWSANLTMQPKKVFA